MNDQPANDILLVKQRLLSNVEVAQDELDFAWDVHRRKYERLIAFYDPMPPDDSLTKAIIKLRTAKLELADWLIEYER